MSLIPAELRGPDVREWPFANGRLSALASEEVVEVPRLVSPEVPATAPQILVREQRLQAGKAGTEGDPLGSFYGLQTVVNPLRVPAVVTITGSPWDVDDELYINGSLASGPQGTGGRENRGNNPPINFSVNLSAGGSFTIAARNVYHTYVGYNVLATFRSVSPVGGTSGSPAVWAMDRYRITTDILTIGVAAPNALSIGPWAHVAPGKVAALAFTRLRVEGGRIYGVPCQGDGTTWQAAVASLRWRLGGMPWWAAAEVSARAGSPVARLAWSDPARTVRFVAGAGTTRAVAVDQGGAVLTASTFGAAEYLADDWYLAGGAIAEPPAVDLTSLVFSGGTTFAVVRSTQTALPDSTNPTNPADPATTNPIPQTGSGFVYSRNGVITLVPARDYETEQLWTP